MVEGKIVEFCENELVLEDVINDCKEPFIGPMNDPAAGEQAADHIRGWRRLSRGMRASLAQVVADEAYFQFGRRARSQANDLVTRKWMRDFLRDHQGLRAKDASTIIELALSLSYIPPESLWDIREAEATRAYSSRVPRSGPQTA